MNKEGKNMKSEKKKQNQKTHTEQEQDKQQKSGDQEKNRQKQEQNQQGDTGQKQEAQTAEQEKQEAEGHKGQTAQQEAKQEGQEKEKGKKQKKKEKTEEKSDKEKLAELQDQYLRLQAEYDNYRKRTLREKMELTRSAGEDILKGLLPVMDDFERALQSIDEAEDAEALKDGVHLIYGKFKDFLNQQGVKAMDSQDKEFDTDKHEAISKVPAPSEEMKGKVVDVVQTGYFLNEKVLRHAKVVVGE